MEDGMALVGQQRRTKFRVKKIARVQRWRTHKDRGRNGLFPKKERSKTIFFFFLNSHTHL